MPTLARRQLATQDWSVAFLLHMQNAAEVQPFLISRTCSTGQRKDGSSLLCLLAASARTARCLGMETWSALALLWQPATAAQCMVCRFPWLSAA